MSTSIVRLTPHDAALLEAFLLAEGGEAADTQCCRGNEGDKLMHNACVPRAMALNKV